ncbi:uncharacterized protein V1518DRAFT_421178 [Limtongia smithiae]|uniref:uncharacterized protein n=1 Tax=Limtongia smithiae TaxID=1125753 RepID=UPI0034CF7668
MSCPHISIRLSPPTASQQVHKEDCTQCFDSPDKPWGVDVCLSCFNGGCNSPDRHHALQHYQLSDHPLVLNVRRTPKPRSERQESPAKIVKLSIPDESDEMKYEIHTSVKCLACGGLELDKESPELSRVVQGVMTSLSSRQQSEVKAWEEEILPCEHTLCLEQDIAMVLADQQLAHCSKCELQGNLWLCLKCGNLGCGRQQFGGVGGNGHGLSHFDETLHPVSVKLGSITPDGTADVYCYLCNEERQDPDLAEHLSHWGIKISERQKVEKSLTELQLEQNMKWEFSMTDDKGDELKPLYGAGFTGLKNLGNSCYLASVLQCLFALPVFQKRYYFEDGDMPLTLEPALDFETQMRKLADGLLSGRYSVPPQADALDRSQQGIPPSMFKSLVGKNHAEFSTMRQQDAFEFLTYLFEFITRAQHKTPSVPNPTSDFRFATEQRLECLACHGVSYKAVSQDSMSITVPVRRLPKASPDDKDTFESVTLHECMDMFTQPEEIQYTCQSCGSRDGATTRTLFKTFPNVLVVNARRFELVNWVPTKLDVPVVVSDQPFSLDKYVAKGLQPDEMPLPEENGSSSAGSASKFTANEGIMSMLEGMGFPPARCEKALYFTGNSDPESATTWLFEHMDDADIDEPLQLESGSAQNGASDEVSADSIAMLSDMGFTEAQAKKALKETGQDMERAVEWLFSHPDDDGSESSPTALTTSSSTDLPGDSALPATFKLQSIICHKGSSVHAGHYVAFIRKLIENEDAWVLYNDEKVVRGGEADEMKKFAYVYFFERMKE